jgi:transposase-like protein
VAKIARDLDVSTETLRSKWVNQAQIDAAEREGLTLLLRNARSFQEAAQRGEGPQGGA